MSQKLFFKVIAKEDKLVINCCVADEEAFDEYADMSQAKWFQMDELKILGQVHFGKTPYKTVSFIFPKGYEVYESPLMKLSVQWLRDRYQIYNGWLIIHDVPCINGKRYHCAKKIQELEDNYNPGMYLCDIDSEKLIEKLLR